MIKDLIYNEGAKIKSIDKGALTTKIKGMLNKYEVMFIYFGGSISYGTFNPHNSDIDVIVFIKGFTGCIHTDLDEFDLFIFGENCIKAREEQTDEVHEYERLFIDDIYSLDKTLIYLNKKYQMEYNSFKNFKVESIMKKYLKTIYDYFMYLYVDSEKPVKWFYHVIRIYGQFQNFLKTGTFNLSMDDIYRNLMMEFKNNYDKESGKEIYANEIPAYLEKFRKYIEEES